MPMIKRARIVSAISPIAVSTDQGDGGLDDELPIQPGRSCWNRSF
jgi:hypothetical protein